jgi:hypothetical protein
VFWLFEIQLPDLQLDNIQHSFWCESDPLRRGLLATEILPPDKPVLVTDKLFIEMCLLMRAFRAQKVIKIFFSGCIAITTPDKRNINA